MFEGIPIYDDPLRGDWILYVHVISLILFLPLITGGTGVSRLIKGLAIRKPYSGSTASPTPVRIWLIPPLTGSVLQIGLLLMHIEMLAEDSNTPDGALFSLWYSIAGTLALLVTGRLILCEILGRATASGKLFRDYLLNIVVLYQIAGVAIIPLNIAVTYMQGVDKTVFIVLGGAIAILLYIFRLIKLAATFNHRNISIIYYILYICALELLPITLLLRIEWPFR